MLIRKDEIQQVNNAMMNMMRDDELEVINEFYEALKAKDIDKSDELFTKLMAEFEANFQSEEGMMEQAGYADAGLHKSDHDLMRKKLAKFHKRWEVLKGPKEVLGFLDKDFKKWYTQHIARWDAQTAPSL